MPFWRILVCPSIALTLLFNLQSAKIIIIIKITFDQPRQACYNELETSRNSHNLLPSHLCIFSSWIRSEGKYSHNCKFLCTEWWWIPTLLGPVPVSWGIAWWVQLIHTVHSTSSSQPFPSNKGLWFTSVVWSPFISRTHCNVKIWL